jgi:hypothetical protein
VPRSEPPPSSGATPRSARPHPSAAETSARAGVGDLLRGTPIPAADLSKQLPLYLRREALAAVLAADALYRRILRTPGVVMEFGIQWGRRLSLFLVLRELYEPYDLNRRVIGFDTFDGFPEVRPEDGDDPAVRPGAFAVSPGYPGYPEHLTQVLDAHEREGFLSHVRRFELCRGDVRQTLPAYLTEHPETVVALAYFDLDLFEPTRAALRLIRDRLVRGSVVAFDDLTRGNFPGETRAVLESLDLPRTALRKLPFPPYPAYLVV